MWHLEHCVSLSSVLSVLAAHCSLSLAGSRCLFTALSLFSACVDLNHITSELAHLPFASDLMDSREENKEIKQTSVWAIWLAACLFSGALVPSHPAWVELSSNSAGRRCGFIFMIMWPWDENLTRMCLQGWDVWELLSAFSTRHDFILMQLIICIYIIYYTSI